MGILSPSFIADLKTQVSEIVVNDYASITKRLWWQNVATSRASATKRERLNWLLDTPILEKIVRDGGEQFFEDMVRVTMEYEHESFGGALTVKREDLEDLDGGIVGGAGIAAVTKWASAMAQQAAYLPQKLVSRAILMNPTAYDGVAFFATNHPVNPRDSARGTFANTFTGAPSGSYPGALPISGVTAEVALENLGKAIAYVSTIKQPNGVDPRNLTVKGIMVPPALAQRAIQLTNARFIAQSAGAGALSGDIEAIVRNMGLGQPIVCPELAANYTFTEKGVTYTGSDSTYYLVVEEPVSDQLGPMLYSTREPIAVSYVGPETDRELAIAREFKWMANGRSVVTPGHPYRLFRFLAT